MIRKLAFALLAASAPISATAAVLVADSGWHEDSIEAAGAPSVNSDWTFTLAGAAILRINDGYGAGDSYSLFDGATLLATTSFAPGEGDIDGFDGNAWTDVNFSRLSYLFGPGSYSLTITGDGAAGLPAGFGVRLDSVGSAVPEPATWAMMIGGFGAVGAVARRRRPTLVSA